MQQQQPSDKTDEQKEINEFENLPDSVEKKEEEVKDLTTNTQVQINPRLIQQLQKPRQFWDTQPVPKINEINAIQPGPIEKGELENVRKEPYALLDMFEWCDVDLNNEDQAKQVYTLLAENYVEDDDNMFRFDYSVDFLRWALLPPGQYHDWIVGVRVKKSQKLVGFITGIPVHLVMEKDSKVRMTEINFLCVHKKLRANRLAPVLIKEITRRVHVRNMWQAVYTAGVVIPTPVSQTRYFHRSLNPKKLIEVGFSSLGPKQTVARQQKLYKLPDETQTIGLRAMKKKDVSQIHKLLNQYLTKFNLYFKYTEEEIKHFFFPRKDVIYTYVVESTDKETKALVITDFLSFYSLPSSVINNPKHDKLKAAYSYYNVSTVTPIVQLMHDALVLAKNEGFDVFNALDIMDNEAFLKELMFSPGDGQLNYYLYNWKLNSTILKPNEIGIVLV